MRAWVLGIRVVALSWLGPVAPPQAQPTRDEWSGASMRVSSGLVVALLVAATAVQVVHPQQPEPQFASRYSALDVRRQHLVDNWVERFNAAAGQTFEPGPFYDDLVVLSTKTTFEAVTNALMQSTLTDQNGAPLGDALSLVERVDTVHGKIPGTRGDNQFRMYVMLTPSAVDTFIRSKEFERGADNSVFHKGYPQNYREQGGTPSIQISVALDNRRADIDVDYRSSSFPAALFNGHLTAANSDVRAGDNYDRHVNRWAGFQNWWRGFLGFSIGGQPQPPDAPSSLGVPPLPRAGKKNIDVMVNDFLTAWLVEGNVLAAMGSVSDRAYACLADDGTTDRVDRGMAPYQLMLHLKAVRDALGPHPSLEGLTTGVRLMLPSLRVVQQPHHAQFVLYAVPDDVAEAFECENRAAPRKTVAAKRTYGNYFGVIFFLTGHQDRTLALLWAKENGYWKIVSWQAGFETGTTPPAEAPPEPTVARIPENPTLVHAARDFLESWFVRKDYDATFRYLSERSYPCYDLNRDPQQPASTSSEDAARKIRAGIERTAAEVGTVRRLDELLVSIEPIHPAVRVMTHRDEHVFGLSSVPTSLADAYDCAARTKGVRFTGAMGTDYDTFFAMNFRIRSAGAEAPVFRLMWREESGSWRIQSYGIEIP